MTPHKAIPGRRRRGAGGFTLVEVLVAMLIVGLVTPFVMVGLITSLARARESQDRGTATAWAQAEIEYLRGQCYERLGPATRKIGSTTRRPGEPNLPAGFAAASVRLEPEGPAGLKATVSLYRQEWSGPAPSASPFLTTSTFIADLRVAGACP